MDDSMIEQGPKPVEKLRWMKKGTLMASALSLIVTSGCNNAEETPPELTFEPTPFATLEPTPTPFPTITPTAISTKSPEIQERVPEKFLELSDGTKIVLDSTGLPLKYTLSNGHEVFFSKTEMEKLREQATTSKEPEIIHMFPLGEDATPRITNLAFLDYIESERNERSASYADKGYSDKHPRTVILPKDVLPSEELEKRGVEIIQPENTSLHIRAGAFEKGGPLADFNKSGRKLTIVLVNGLTIDPYYMQDIKT